MKTIKDSFKRRVAMKIALDGAFQRNAIYSKDLKREVKKELRNYIRKESDEIISRVTDGNKVDEDQYIDHLKSFSKKVNKEQKKLLTKELNFGTTQKLINLYWKMLWLFELVKEEPVHCPFDSIVIKLLEKDVQDIRWTKVTKVSDYKKLVKSARNVAGGQSLAMWELDEYNKAVA